MSVLIKGGVMPKSCRECFDNCLNIAADCEHCEGKILNADEREPGCPLVEVPEPHGRLIDADVRAKEVCIYTHCIGDDCRIRDRCTFDAPTVIEAEGE